MAKVKRPGLAGYLGLAFMGLAIKLVVLLLSVIQYAIAGTGEFQRIETETLDKKPFVFPQDLRAGKLNIVMLAISEEQENGTWQGEALVEWYAALQNAGMLSTDVMAWHFSVLKVPFFVKGLVRGGLADSYNGRIPLNQAAAIFIKDIAAFAKSANITLDGQPTIILVSPSGELLETFKGKVSTVKVSAMDEAVNRLTSSVRVVKNLN